MLIAFIICFFSFVLSFIASKQKIFSPAVITSGIWTFVLFFHLILDTNLNILTDKFFLAISIWVISFCFASLLMQSLYVNKSVIQPSKLARNIFYYTSLITLPFFLLKVYEISNMGISSNWMTAMRLVTVGAVKKVDMEETSPFYVIIWFVSYLIELYNYSKENRKRVFVLLAIYLFFAFATMSKTNFLTLFFGSAFILYTKKIFKLKHLIIGIAGLIIIFLAIQSLRTTSKENKNHYVHDMITLYILSPDAAFETIKPASSYYYGENVFRSYYALKYKLGYSRDKPIKIILEFVNVGVFTNTYTILYPFYKDFGITGVLIWGIVLGLFMGYIYSNGESGNLMLMLFYSFIIPQIIMQFAGEFFLTNISLNIKQFIILCIPFLITKYNLFSRNKI